MQRIRKRPGNRVPATSAAAPLHRGGAYHQEHADLAPDDQLKARPVSSELPVPHPEHFVSEAQVSMSPEAQVVPYIAWPSKPLVRRALSCPGGQLGLCVAGPHLSQDSPEQVLILRTDRRTLAETPGLTSLTLRLSHHGHMRVGARSDQPVGPQGRAYEVFHLRANNGLFFTTRHFSAWTRSYGPKPDVLSQSTI